MLSNFEIEELGSALIPDWVGCYSRDQLPAKRKPGSYVLNLQAMFGGDEQGTHWTAMWVPPASSPYGKALFYYDPYGGWPPENVQQFSEIRPQRALKWNREQVQDEESQSCGYFSLYWLWQIAKGVSPYRALDMYSEDTQSNEDVIQTAIRSMRQASR